MNASQLIQITDIRSADFVSFNPDELIVFFLLINSLHVAVEVIVNILGPVTGSKGP